MGKTILAIDPGNVLSGWCMIDEDTLKPLNFDKSYNHDVLYLMEQGATALWLDEVVIERVASYGMVVGAEVFQTCEWIGRFTQKAEENNIPVRYIYRNAEKIHICHDTKAKDANIRRALIDRFAQHDLKNGKGTKDDPDWFYGFRADIWSAYAVGLTYIERSKYGQEGME